MVLKYNTLCAELVMKIMYMKLTIDKVKKVIDWLISAFG
jgi:hypothetical protein